MIHDPGGKVRLPIKPDVIGDAEFSPCGQYRYWLSRRLDQSSAYAMWIGMNPSTAEAHVDDPTIRRECAFTWGMGFHYYLKYNVMDYRATSPKRLLEPGVNPCSDGNLEAIAEAAKEAAVIIAAWGALPKQLRRYADAVVAAIKGPIMCMGVTQDGSPRHPLYLRNDTRPIVWRP